MDDVFEILEQAYSNHADEVTVDYSQSGYPTQVFIDYYKDAVDDELGLGVSDLTMSTE